MIRILLFSYKSKTYKSGLMTKSVLLEMLSSLKNELIFEI